MNREKEAGFTILELVIVIAVLSVVMGGTVWVLLSSQETFDEGTARLDLETDAARLIDILKDNINECLVITASAPTTSNNYATVTIKVPVLVSGSYWDPVSGAIYWGAEGNQNWYITCSFEQTETLSESTLGRDYNRDGDISDTFDLGKIWMRVYNGSDVLQSSTALCSDVITVATTRYLDINNDGVSDPIFSLLDRDGRIVTTSPSSVRLNVWLGGRLGAQDLPIIVNNNIKIVLLNPQ